MGKKPIEIKIIPSRKARNTTFRVRKRGLIRKTIELSMLCSKSVFCGIIDKENKSLIIYQSHPGNIKEIVRCIEDDSFRKEYLTNDYYEKFEDIYYSKLKKRNGSSHLPRKITQELPVNYHVNNEERISDIKSEKRNDNFLNLKKSSLSYDKLCLESQSGSNLDPSKIDSSQNMIIKKDASDPNCNSQTSRLEEFLNEDSAHAINFLMEYIRSSGSTSHAETEELYQAMFSHLLSSNDMTENLLKN